MIGVLVDFQVSLLLFDVKNMLDTVDSVFFDEKLSLFEHCLFLFCLFLGYLLFKGGLTSLFFFVSQESP